MIDLVEYLVKNFASLAQLLVFCFSKSPSVAIDSETK